MSDRYIADSDDREAWLRARRRYFTASDAAALMGEHEYTNIQRVVNEKRTGVSDFDGRQDHVVQGLAGEGFVAEYARQAFGVTLEHHGQLIAHPWCAHLAATPDFVSPDATALGADAGPCSVQVKFTLAKRGDQGPVVRLSPPSAKKCMQWGPMIPRYIWWQAQLEMACLQVKQTVVLAYHRRAIPSFGSPLGGQLGAYLVRLDRDAQASLVDAAKAWSDCLHKGEGNGE